MKLLNTSNRQKIRSYIDWWIRQELTVMYCRHKLNGKEIAGILSKKLQTKFSDMILNYDLDTVSYIFVVYHPFTNSSKIKHYNAIYVATQVSKDNLIYSMSRLYELDRLSI